MPWGTSVADISSEDLGAIEPVLRSLGVGEISSTADAFQVEAATAGKDARELVCRLAWQRRGP